VIDQLERRTSRLAVAIRGSDGVEDTVRADDLVRHIAGMGATFGTIAMRATSRRETAAGRLEAARRLALSGLMDVEAMLAGRQA